MAEVVLENISKSYDKKNLAVDNVNLKINDKEFVILVGPSGCGKSTTLRMIAGLEEITAGNLYIDNKLVNDIEPKDRDIAMVFQNYALYPHMTVFENMAFGLKLRKFNKKEIKQRVEEAAEILELENLLERKPKALSGGQRQRVAVGRAIVRKPKVFLFDEPLSNLDAKLRVQMRTEISRLHNKIGVTMIYVTHDQTEAMTMGDRIVIMKDGLVQQIDKPLQIYNNPANKFVAGFIGSPPMNFIEGKLIDEQGLKFRVGSISIPVDESMRSELSAKLNKNIELGIRPENFIITDENPHFLLKPEVIEPLGNETMLYFLMEGKQLIVRTDASSEFTLENEIGLKLETEKIHWFGS